MSIKERFAVYDLETTNWINFEIGGFYDGQQYFEFVSLAKFLDFINKKSYDGLRIYAHNGGKFDFLFILEQVIRRGWVTKIIERAGRIIALRLDTGKAKLTFADSYALLPDSLARLSQAFQPKHKKLDMDYKKISRHSARTRRYLENDCLCLWEILYDFFHLSFIETPQLTIASQAMNTFRTQFVPSELVRVSLRNEEICRRFFYHGGRVEVYKGTGTNINAYDVNSLYPSVMVEEMPCGTLRRQKTFSKGKIGFYDVTIKNTPDWYISPLLWKGDKKLMFVNGPGRYYLSSAMLNYLVSEFAVHFTVNRAWVFQDKEDLFSPYVSTFYKLKQAHKGGHDALYYLSKYMLNALYGKFAQSRWTEVIKPGNGYDEGVVSAFPPLDEYGLVLVKEETRSKFIMPFLAAWITDLARLKHFQLMNQNPGAVYYCDTDSIYTTGKYKTSDKLGDLSFEGKYERGIFLNAKSYALRNGEKTKIAFKGFNSSELHWSDFEAAAYDGTPVTEERNRILSYRECLSRKTGITRDKGTFLKTVTVKKIARPDYDKRLTFPSKRHIFDSRPFTFKEVTKGK